MPLQDYYNTGDEHSRICYTTSIFIAQTFTASSNYDIVSVKLKLFKTGSPGNITIELQGVTASKPNNVTLASGTTNGDTLTADSGGEWRTITFETPYSIVNGNEYAIVIKPTGGDVDNATNWRADWIDPGYGNGAYCYTINGGTSWTRSTDWDLMFETYSASGVIITPHYYNKLLVGNS